MSAAAAPSLDRPARPGLVVPGVVAASFLLGGLTSWAQGFLPDALAPFANSSSGWTVLTVALVASARPRPALGAVLGVLSFVALVLGYTVASELRGLAYSPVLWGAVGIVAGPFVGTAAAALAGRDRRLAAAGAGAIAGVLVADAVYGLTVVAGSTSAVYWTLCLVAAVALVGATMRRFPSPTTALISVVTTLAATGVLTAGYAVLNAIG